MERSKQSTCELSFPYIVDMSSKKQINRNTGRERSVRRREDRRGQRVVHICAADAGVRRSGRCGRRVLRRVSATGTGD